MTATSTMIHVRIDERTKTEATKSLKKMGLSVSDVVRIVLKRIATEKALPFEVRVPNLKTAEAIMEARQGHLPSFSSVAELMSDLNDEK